MKEYLSELEVAAIERFCADTAMFNAVKKVLFEGVYYNGVMIPGTIHNPLRNPALTLVARQDGNIASDKELADDLRAMWSGINTVESTFAGLLKIKAPVKEPAQKSRNKAV